MKLTEQINRQIQQPASAAIQGLVDTLLTTYGSAIEAILFYGSCLRSGDDRGGLVDLYVLVNRYRAIESRHVLAALNKLLPPNVFYLEVPFADRMVRAKYAVFSIDDFIKGASWQGFHSYVWGRFAQPVGLIYARNDQTVRRVRSALVQAVLTFIARVLPRVPSPFTARDLWHHGLRLSYRAELRAERPDKLVRLIEATPEYYEQITRAAIELLSLPVEIHQKDGQYIYTTAISDRSRRASRIDWVVRSWQGKMLSVLRLVKGTLTFRGGLDYILWKIERHSGLHIEVPPRLRRYPLVATCVIFWRLYRQGAYR